jgi:type II secretion system protein H
MPSKFQKIQSGFTLVELLVVLAIITIMTVVVLGINNSDNKATTDVDSIARQLAAEIRVLQNEALNGKIVGGTTACKYVLNVSAASYMVRYLDCTASQDVINAGTKVVNLPDKRVTLSANPSGIVFSSPMGTVSSSQKITVTSIVSASVAACVTVSSDGSVMEEKNACP